MNEHRKFLKKNEELAISHFLRKIFKPSPSPRSNTHISHKIGRRMSYSIGIRHSVLKEIPDHISNMPMSVPTRLQMLVGHVV